MQKKYAKLSSAQLIGYRPPSLQPVSRLSFAEEMGLLPATTSGTTLEAMVCTQLGTSICTTPAVAYVARELGIEPSQMKAPEYLLVLYAINQLGGGVNDGKLVICDDAEPPPKRQRVSLAPPVDLAWKNYGAEPANLGKQRVGKGVGGGMTKVHIWDLKFREERSNGEWR